MELFVYVHYFEKKLVLASNPDEAERKFAEYLANSENAPKRDKWVMRRTLMQISDGVFLDS